VTAVANISPCKAHLAAIGEGGKLPSCLQNSSATIAISSIPGPLGERRGTRLRALRKALSTTPERLIMRFPRRAWSGPGR
jgi:hypothetical protein